MENLICMLCATASKEKEYEQIIRQTFEPVIVTENFPRAVISIVVQVIEDNGSILSVAINAVSLALLDAGVPMIAIVTSATCGLLPDGNLFLDPSLAEEEVRCAAAPSSYFTRFFTTLTHTFLRVSLWSITL